MADAQVLIGKITLTAAQATVSFTNLPQNYRDLKLVITATNSVGASNGIWMRFNDDAGGNYSYTYMRGSGSAAYGTSVTGTTYSSIGWLSNTNPTPVQASIMDYTATDKHKMVISRSDEVAGYLFAWVNRWASTSAINSLTLFNESSGNFAIGSTFTLYGVLG